MDQLIADSIQKSSQVILSLQNQRETIQAICKEITSALANGNKILTAGHGGSAAEALHMSEELVGRFLGDRIPLPSICLVSDGPLLTCIANDYGFDALFPRQVQAHGQPGDVLVMFTTSGNGKNFSDSVKIAKEKDIKTIAISGKTGGDIKDQTTHQLIVSSNETARIQEAHTLIMHMILEAVERAFPPAD